MWEGGGTCHTRQGESSTSISSGPWACAEVWLGGLITHCARRRTDPGVCPALCPLQHRTREGSGLTCCGAGGEGQGRGGRAFVWNAMVLISAATMAIIFS